MNVNDISEPKITEGYLLEFDGWKSYGKGNGEKY